MADAASGPPDLATLSSYVVAAGALGTAAYGLVDATKSVAGGLSNPGFGYVRKRVMPLLQGGAGALAPDEAEQTLRANWLNGVAKADQKAIAKSMIRLNMTAGNAQALATSLGLPNPADFEAVADKAAQGAALTPAETGLLGRFDALLSARLDAAYERADQFYRNTAKLAAAVIAVALSLGFASFTGQGLTMALITGLAATPLAPVAKDLATSLGQAATALRGLRR